MDKLGVAVVAVHGVGQHEAGGTAALIARQLQSAAPDRFHHFNCTPLHIAVDTGGLPIPAGDPAQDAAGRSALPPSVGARARAAGPATDGADATDIDFTAITLAEGAGYADSYVTTRLRCAQAGQETVDLYELFWSDLSHGGKQGGLSALRQSLQLFLHVASLGRTALGTLLASRDSRDPIPVLSFLYGAAAWGYWLLAVPIALGNILLLALGAAFLALLVPDSEAGSIGATVAAALVLATAGGMAFQRLMRRPGMPAWLQRQGLPAIWLGGIAVAALGVWWDGQQFVKAADAAFMLALPVALLAATAFVRRYDISRPGALSAWSIMLAASAVWGLAARFVMSARGVRIDVLNWCVYFAEGVFAGLVVAWGALAAVNLCLLGCSLYAKRRYAAYPDVSASIDTGLVAAALPAPLLLTVVLTLWAAVAQLLGASGAALMQVQVPGVFSAGATSVGARLNTLIDLSASPAATPFLVCMVLALACAVLAFLPSILSELLPPRTPADAGRTLGLWRWLNEGFRLLHAAKWIAVSAFFVLLPGGALFQYWQVFDWGRQDLGFALGGSALAYLSVTRLLGGVSLSKFSNVFKGLRVVIDTAIDVDNWLRERPEGDTPRLRIMARYVSLLRYLREQGYARIVIVSHSQGTVVTLDLLRYLKARNPGFLEHLAPIDLLTVGSPLRQLYAARFPGIYGWARDADPSQAGLASWVNGYGSGDYVGRNLWTGNEATRWQAAAAGSPYDFCIGALAHLHYFDRNAPDVARAIMATLGHRLEQVPPGLQEAA